MYVVVALVFVILLHANCIVLYQSCLLRTGEVLPACVLKAVRSRLAAWKECEHQSVLVRNTESLLQSKITLGV